MSRVTIANSTVRRVIHMSACIPRFHSLNSLDLIKNGFQTPETSPSQRRGLKIGVHMITPFCPALAGSFVLTIRQRMGGKSY
jgi:hypothetical protein